MRSVISCIVFMCVVTMMTANLTASAQDVPKTKLNYAAMTKLGWKLSVQAWTFRDLTLFETIDLLGKMGVRYLEMYPGQRISKEDNAGFNEGASQAQIDSVLARCKINNVTPINYGVTGIAGDEAGARRMFDFAKKLGLQTLVCEPDEAAVPMLDKLCQEYKINIAFHNHPQPSHYWSPETVLKVAKGCSNRVGSCSDTGHWYRSGLNAIDCIKQLKGRIISLHFKDLNEKKEDHAWGGGVQDAMGMLTELKKQGFKGVFSNEYESTTGQELIDNVVKCNEFFSKACTKLAAGR